MPFDYRSLCLLHALLDDNCISFNINRSQETFSQFPREVIALYSTPTDETIVPGVASAKDKTLLNELRKIQNWRRVKEHSFELGRTTFSLLWRFSGKGRIAREQLIRPVSLNAKNARKFWNALKKYRSSLQSNLRPGKVFLMPDTAVTFNNPHRLRQIYARPVLVFAVRPNQVTCIPFSTKTDRMNKTTDILFDTEYQGECLDIDGTPAVENYPYNFISKKTALFVSASQSDTKENFLSAALIQRGVVRLELLKFIEERMKISLSKP